MKKLIALLPALLLNISLYAQPEKIPFLGDKPGTFEILSRTDYSYRLKFTPAEMAANLEHLNLPLQK